MTTDELNSRLRQLEQRERFLRAQRHREADPNRCYELGRQLFSVREEKSALMGQVMR